ncbi:hypothetical protein [Kiritimatiella glycovorans]|uniref:Uncharacterized protein n=1 Tax=Kiritimatiella glycovorans TaxID=1307763 RepID=A0A0G3EC91_9BACT|nr:hypothetical protein [Kiritimatiella glycovorans]AKJ63908.1 hypothetical protein L21SP4_00639 [Kiritimatiella glycovorans]
MNTNQYRLLSRLCLLLGFLSIVGAVLVWFLAGGTTPEKQAYAERFGIFIGLWVPSFFALSTRLDRCAEARGE